ncbi:MAG: dodecin family protein [Nitrososphaeraceae archaeon]|jgi:dodecin
MVYKYIHIIGTSSNNIDDAVKEAIDEASKTINNIEWAELGRVTFRILDNQVKEFQAEVKIGFKIERKD